MEFCMNNFQAYFSDWWWRYHLWNCPNMNVTGLHWWSVNIGSQWLGAVRQQAITWASVDLDPCRHITSLGHIELNVEQCVVIHNVIHITFAAQKDTFASSFILSEFKPISFLVLQFSRYWPKYGEFLWCYSFSFAYPVLDDDPANVPVLWQCYTENLWEFSAFLP